MCNWSFVLEIDYSFMYRQELQLCDKNFKLWYKLLLYYLKKYKFEIKIKHEMEIEAKEYHKAKIALLYGT